MTRTDYDPSRSDVDVLVEFRKGQTPGLRFFATMPNELSSILGNRRVDLFTFDELTPAIAGNVAGDLVEFYVAPN